MIKDIRSTQQAEADPLGTSAREKHLKLQQFSILHEVHAIGRTLADKHAAISRKRRQFSRSKGRSVANPSLPPHPNSIVCSIQKLSRFSSLPASYSSSPSAAAPGGFSLPNVLSWMMSRYLVVRCLQLT